MLFRSLEYRAVAELIRHLRFLAHVGEYGSIHQLTATQSAPRGAWMRWYALATIRELGLPGAEISREHQWALLQAVRAKELEAQIDYHERNAEKMDHAEHFLHSAGWFLFATVAMMLVLIVLAFLFRSFLPASVDPSVLRPIEIGRAHV